jgi:hypothetical protein
LTAGDLREYAGHNSRSLAKELTTFRRKIRLSSIFRLEP